MEETKTLEPYELSYSDLFLVSSHPHDQPSLSQSELRRMESVRAKMMDALGPTGPGLLAVTGVPNTANLRRDLSLARGLALLDPDRRKLILKEQKLGSDVPLKDPQRKVSSFAMQLRYGRNSMADASEEFRDVVDVDVDHEYKNIGRNLQELGFVMVEIGVRIARACDAAIGAGSDLERSLLESSAAKGRLIHYHSQLDLRVLLKQRLKRKGTELKSGSDCCDDHTRFDIWQQWHFDYGIFTVLTAPLFLAQQVIEEGDRFVESCGKECGYPNGHTLLQVFHPRKKGIFNVKASPESFIVQVGESAEVISRGILQAPLHSVAGPGKLANLSREAFVVFLQPSWDKVMQITYDIDKRRNLDDEPVGERSEEQLSIERIQKIVPPLSSRLKDGMTFADFSHETTKQYYGGKGLQSNR